jgi:hypothetical protein
MSTGGRTDVALAAAVGARIAAAMTPADNSDVRKLLLLRILQNCATVNTFRHRWPEFLHPAGRKFIPPTKQVLPDD